MNKLISTFALISIAFVSNAQQFTAQDEASTTKSVTNISILSPAITHEIAVSPRQTILIGAELGIIAKYRIANGIENSFATLIPQIKADFRHYYNFEKRLAKGKNIDKNSGNYLALRTMYIFDPVVNKENFPNYNNGLALGGVWGIQRIYKSGIYFGLSIGGGFIFGDEKFDTTGMGDIHLGFNIGASSKR